MSSDDPKGIAPPLVELPISTADRGFYDGFSRQVTIPAKIIVTLIILWAIFFPVSANETLSAANSTIISSFAGWYVYLVAALIAICAILAIFPQTGSLRIGYAIIKPFQFSKLKIVCGINNYLQIAIILCL